DPVVQPLRLIEVEEAAAEVVEDVAHAFGLDRGDATEEEVVAEHVAGKELDSLGGAESRCNERVTPGQVERDLPPRRVTPRFSRGAAVRIALEPLPSERGGCSCLRPGGGGVVTGGAGIGERRLAQGDPGHVQRVLPEGEAIDPVRALDVASEDEAAIVGKPDRVEGAAGERGEPPT